MISYVSITTPNAETAGALKIALFLDCDGKSIAYISLLVQTESFSPATVALMLLVSPSVDVFIASYFASGVELLASQPLCFLYRFSYWPRYDLVNISRTLRTS